MNTAVALQPIWDDELPSVGRSGPAWLVHGLVAKGYTTLLTSQWKAGKTTLLSLLLSRRATGGKVGGLAVTAGRTAVVSEEPLDLWADRGRRYNFGGNTCFFTQPFLGVPRPDEWQALIDSILVVHQARGLDLVAIDPLAPFLRCENNAQSLLETLRPLQALTRAKIGVLLLHHPGKGEPPIGQAARGSGALLGHVDISIEMRHPGGDPLTRRRRFHCLSRFADTPCQLLLELNADGTDYLAIADPLLDEFLASWQFVVMVLGDAPQKLTRGDMLSEWPPEFDKPHRNTLHRWLRRAVERDMVLCEGTGRKADPYRYWLPEAEARWRAINPLYDLLEQQSRDRHLLFGSSE